MLRGSMVFGLGILSLALLVSASDSQEKKGKAKGQLPAGWKALNLTEAQKEKVYEINAEYKSKIDELSKKVKELESQRNKARVAVLTDEQRQQLAKLVIGEDTKKKEKTPERKPSDK